MELNDYFAIEHRDYVIDGDFKFYREEIINWGGEWNNGLKAYTLSYTNELCPDYQAIIDMGLDLLSLQETYDCWSFNIDR